MWSFNTLFLLISIAGVCTTFAILRDKKASSKAKNISALLLVAFIIIIIITLKNGVKNHEYGFAWQILLFLGAAPIAVIASIITTVMCYSDFAEEKEKAKESYKWQWTANETKFALSLFTTITIVLLAITMYVSFGVNIFDWW